MQSIFSLGGGFLKVKATKTVARDMLQYFVSGRRVGGVLDCFPSSTRSNVCVPENVCFAVCPCCVVVVVVG